MSRPRVLLADDHRMVAEGLKSLLPDEFELVGVVDYYATPDRFHPWWW